MTDGPRDTDGTVRVRRELLTLLTEANEVDLGTVYRCLVELLGIEAITDIGVVIARLCREGTISIETHRGSPFDPLVGVVRLADRPHVPSSRVA